MTIIHPGHLSWLTILSVQMQGIILPPKTLKWTDVNFTNYPTYCTVQMYNSSEPTCVSAFPSHNVSAYGTLGDAAMMYPPTHCTSYSTIGKSLANNTNYPALVSALASNTNLPPLVSDAPMTNTLTLFVSTFATDTRCSSSEASHAEMMPANDGGTAYFQNPDTMNMQLQIDNGTGTYSNPQGQEGKKKSTHGRPRGAKNVDPNGSSRRGGCQSEKEM